MMAVTLGGIGNMQKSINSSWRLGLSPTWTTSRTHSAAATADQPYCKPGWSHLRLKSNLWLIGNHLTAPLAAAIYQAWIVTLNFLTSSDVNPSSPSRYDSMLWPTKTLCKGRYFLSYQYTLVKHVQQHTCTQNSWTTTEIIILSYRALSREHGELEIAAACTCWNY